MSSTLGSEQGWWRDAVIYHIYPRSFQDSNGDGIGDLQGILDRLDYLNDGTERSLGVDAIWLSPIFPSPLKDFGYDVSDHTAVDPAFGDLATIDRLIKACHERGVRLLLDFVLNHTSDEHPWFRDSRASRTSQRRDWYIWRDPGPGGAPPNNWPSVFGGSAWTHEQSTGQAYLHTFLREQPDLNWRNPAVASAMHDVLRFWMGRGVDGFRLDAVGHLLKHPELLDDPFDPAADSSGPRPLPAHSYLLPDVIEPLRGIRRVLDERPGCIAIGELYGPPEQRAMFYGPPDLDGLHLMFDFGFITDQPLVTTWATPWSADAIAAVLNATSLGLPPGALPCFALGNHDRPRLRTRLRHDHDRDGRHLARAAALLHLALPGPVCLYYGEEIGMVDVSIPPGREVDPLGRDHSRTPMQWDRSPHRGFTAGEPWLPFGPADIDVASQLDDPASLLSLYRRAVTVRKREPALRFGEIDGIVVANDVVTFRRHHPRERSVTVVVNTGAERRDLALGYEAEELVLASDDRSALVGARAVSLPPFAAAWVAEPW
jgi:alpha-glucosidase